MTPRIGIDLGGSKIEVIALDEAGRELLRRRVATPAGDYGATLDAVAALVADAERALGGHASVGVATPGALSPASGLLRNSNSVCLNGKPLKQDLERRLAREIRIANDANCFALSEAADGAGHGAQVVFGVILGTGVGGGVIANGHLLHGTNAVAGEWGHNPLPWPDHEERLGPPCYCGKTGCIETFLSGPGLARDHERRSGERLDPPQIVERAVAGDAASEAALQRYEARLAKSLATVINLLDPDVIVLGGGLSNIARL
ncbi:MAG TPA: ROK family protein [Burkholderiales bacterium]|nr:ROK family protein [Burkholderiales bacterium]